MARNDGRIEPGQRLSSAISARAWNRAQLAADVVLGVGTGATADGPQYGSAPYTWVYAKNSTGSDFARWGVMAITGVEVAPTSDDAADATKQFQSMPVLTGGTPTATTTGWCVSVEPIAAGKIGRVAVAGVVQVRMSDVSGLARSQIIWKNDDWALVNLNSGTRLGTISSTWNKGNTATVIEQNGDGSATSGSSTFTAKNYFATVTVASNATKRVACSLVGSTWILIAAEC